MLEGKALVVAVMMLTAAPLVVTDDGRAIVGDVTNEVADLFIDEEKIAEDPNLNEVLDDAMGDCLTLEEWKQSDVTSKENYVKDEVERKDSESKKEESKKDDGSRNEDNKEEDCITEAYGMLKEEGVDEGLAFNMGIKINNEAKYAIILSSIIGTLYSINHFFFADGYAGAGGSTLLAGFEEGSYWDDPIAAAPIAYRVLASFFVIYVSMGLILLTNGAKGNWAAAHVLLFGITFFALSIILGNLVVNDQVIPDDPNSPYTPDTSTATANIAVSALVMFLNIFAYYKMRDEGVEEGMTFGGEDFGNSDDFFYKMYPAVTAAFVVLLLIANFVTQVQ